MAQERRTSLKELFVRGRSPVSEFWALRDVSLEVERGTTYGLIGHNGSGKSTLLKLMANIHRPTSGTISHDGRVSALLELGAGFHPELSGRENIYLNGSILGMPRKKIDDAFDRILEFAGLGDFIDSPVKVYSSGMYARLGFSIAVHLDPEILIVDEILAVGDEDFQRRCFDYLSELRSRGVTIVFVSHSLPLVQTMCDRVAWLDHGSLVMEGPAVEVVDAYVEDVNRKENKRVVRTQAAHPVRGLDTTTRRGTGELEITAVDVLADSGGLPVMGEGLTIRVHYDAHQPITSPVFALAFYPEHGQKVAGPNSVTRDLGTLSGPGYVDYRLDALPLQHGHWSVSLGVTNSTYTHVYDHLDRALKLTVQAGSGPAQAGDVLLPGSWTQSTVAEPSLEESR
jgi:ABC-2 type transport system ATP-binding protein/lipopolysaccharide transport system ATP-binding protein